LYADKDQDGKISFSEFSEVKGPQWMIFQTY
jgi:Ca2+-binding EF-hand superfamily protein